MYVKDFNVKFYATKACERSKPNIQNTFSILYQKWKGLRSGTERSGMNNKILVITHRIE